MHIIFLRFGPNRAQAGQWLAAHKAWLETGVTDGAFLMAGSLDAAQGGVVLTSKLTPTEAQQRVEQDPFVVHGVVTAEVHGVTPSRVAAGWTSLLAAADAGAHPA